MRESLRNVDTGNDSEGETMYLFISFNAKAYEYHSSQSSIMQLDLLMKISSVFHLPAS